MDIVERLTVSPSIDASGHVKGAAEMVSANKRISDSAEVVDASLKKKTATTRNYGGAIERLAGQLDKPTGALQIMEKRLGLLDKALGAGSLSLEKHAALTAKVKSTYDATVSALSRHDVALGRTSNVVHGVFGRLAGAADNVEGSLKRGVRSLGDMRGTIELIGPAGAGAARSLGLMAGTLGNVADAAGVLALVLSRHPILAIATVIVGAVSALYLLGDSTKTATSALDAHADAMKKATALTTQSEEASRRAILVKEAEARADLNGAIALNKKALAEEEAARARAEGVSDRLGAARRNGQPVTAEAIERAGATLDALASRATATADRIAELEGQLRKLSQVAPVLDDVAKRAIATEDAFASDRRADFSKDWERRKAIIESLIEPTELYRRAVLDLNAARVAGDVLPADYERRLGNLNAWLYQTSGAYAGVRAEVERNAKSAALQEAWEDARKPDVAGDLKRRDAILRSLRTATDDYEDQVRELNIAYEKGDVDGAAYNRRLQNLNSWLHDISPAAESARQATADLDRQIERIGDRVTDFASDTIFDALMGKAANLWETFEQLGKRAIADVAAEMLVRPFVIQVASSALGAGGPPTEGEMKHGEPGPLEIAA